MTTATVLHVGMWYSSAGTNLYQDMAWCLLSNGKETGLVYPHVGQTVYYHEDEGGWFSFPPDEI